MKTLNIRLMPILLVGLAVAVLVSGCKKGEDPAPENQTFSFQPAADNQTAVQEALILMEECDTISFTAGTFNFTGTLSIDSKNCVVIRGAGKDQTTLNFADQTQGAEGIKANNVSWFLIQDLTIKDPVGDGIKVKDSDGVSMINFGVEYSSAGDPDNGAYGIYPVTSENVYINNCYVKGASDAGIYVGQTKDAIVSNCIVEGNVAGIEIENCIRSDVFNNTATNNTGGILAFDLENLPVIPTGNSCRIFNNTLINNSHPNFAPPGNTVETVPVGTGIMVLSYDNVEIFGNTITNNNVMGIGLISMYTVKFIDGNTNPTFEDYDPWNYRINIHDNTVTRNSTYPAEADRNASANLLIDNFPDPADMPTIIYDGFIAPEYENDDTEGICIDETNVTFVDLNVQAAFTGKRFNIEQHACTPAPAPIAPVVVDAPGI